MVLEKSPLSPGIWPVAMPAAFAVVNVGKIEWVLANRTPFFISANIVGAAASVTMPGRRPSATNRITLCGRCWA